MKMWYERIRELREDLPVKKSQSEVAKDLKITQRKLSYIETGKTEPSIEDMIRICEYYGVSSDYILGLAEK
ncbi:MAG: helix-turn-helix transcriptional regulator [Clostridia bacterium]|nr:helix-turn-helix transcriptional regulator [Clostridia bacterium]